MSRSMTMTMAIVFVAVRVGGRDGDGYEIRDRPSTREWNGTEGETTYFTTRMYGYTASFRSVG